MNYFSKIFMFVFALVILCGCEQKSLVGGGTSGDGDDIFIPTDGYIFFNVTRPKTRGTLIEGTLEDHFNVLGYNYNKTNDGWGAAKVLASQVYPVTYGDYTVPMGVFNDKFKTEGQTEETIDETGVQTISWNGTTHSYLYKEKLKPWIAKLDYAFFAWYPTTLTVNGVPSGDPSSRNETDLTAPIRTGAFHIGEPYLTYTLPNNRADMVDVLTACRININKNDVETGTGTVNFTMKHRLAAVDLKATNIITGESLQKAWAGKDGIDTSNIDPAAKGTIVDITDLSLTFDDIYTKADKIYLNSNDNTLTTEASQSVVRSYSFDCTGVTIGKFGEAEDEVKETTSLMCDEGGYLIFIPDENRPENDPITVTLKLKYYVTCPKKDGEGDYKVEYNYTDRADLTTDIAILKEGHMHNLLLTFTASGVYLRAQVSQDWTEKEIYHEFD